MRRGRSARWSAACAVAGLLGALLVGGTPTQLAAGAAATEPAAPKVRLLDAGAEPREPLRLALVEGPTPPMVMTMTTAIEQTVGSQHQESATPPIRVVADLAVTRVASDGGGDYTGRYAEVEVVDDGSVDAATLGAMEEQLAGLVGVSFETSVSGRNETGEATFLDTDELPDSVRSVLDQLGGQIGGLAAPFPVEPVGAGARWRVTSKVRLSGIDVVSTTTVRLTERSGSSATLEITIAQVAPPQRIEYPGLPANATARVVKFRTTGTGTSILDLAAVAPIEGHAESEAEQVLVVRAGGESARVVQHLTTSVDLGST